MDGEVQSGACPFPPRGRIPGGGSPPRLFLTRAEMFPFQMRGRISCLKLAAPIFARKRPTRGSGTACGNLPLKSDERNPTPLRWVLRGQGRSVGHALWGRSEWPPLSWPFSSPLDEVVPHGHDLSGRLARETSLPAGHGRRRVSSRSAASRNTRRVAGHKHLAIRDRPR